MQKKLLYVVVFFLLLDLCKAPLPLGINYTKSLPYTLFYQKIGKRVPSRGDYVVCWKGNKRYIKQVIGLPGDEVLIKEQKCFVAMQEVGRVLSQHPQSLRKFQALQVSCIPQGAFFLAGTHEQSFDSRYEEFGLVKQEEIQGCYAALL